MNVSPRLNRNPDYFTNFGNNIYVPFCFFPRGLINEFSKKIGSLCGPDFLSLSTGTVTVTQVFVILF